MNRDLFYHVKVSAPGAEYDLSEDITSLTVDQRDSGPDELTIRMSDPYTVFGHAIQEGMDVQVDMGTVSDHSVIFRGRFYRVSGSFPEKGVPTLDLVAYDNTMRMGLVVRNRPWKGRALDSIVRALAKDVFNDNVRVTLDGNPTFTGNGIRQVEMTDLDFLMELAALCGCVVFPRTEGATGTETLHLVAQSRVMKSPVATFHYGRCDVDDRLLRFDPSADAKNIRLPRLLSAADQDAGKPIPPVPSGEPPPTETGDQHRAENLTVFRKKEPEKADALKRLLDAARAARETLVKELGTVERAAIPTFANQAHADEIKKNQHNTSLHGMQGSGAALGAHRLMACSSIKIEGVGDRFSGVWYVPQVRHTLDREGYKTEFECRR